MHMSLVTDGHLKEVRFDYFGKQIRIMQVFMTACGVWNTAPKSQHST